MKFGSLPSKSLLFRLSSSSTTQSHRRTITFFITNIHSSPFSTTTTSGSNFVSGSSHSPSRRPQQDEESRSVRVSVWWDFLSCNLPVDTNVYKVAQSITAAIRNSGIKGPITITAFGDVLQLPRSNQDALSATGISLTHVPNGGKNSADRSLITDLMCWVSQNPPPAHLLLISSDKEFASVLHRLRMNNYNILLASKSSAPGVLCSAASIMWDWDALIKGECVTGKHFNQPPDGPYNSWYGHYRIPLLDPFAIATTTEQSSSSVKIEELSESVNSNAIRSIVSLYPKGAAITELRAELSKSNLAIDKDFYGHKKFSKFLLSMPDILQVTTVSEGLFMIRAVTEKKPPMRLDSSPRLSTAVDQKIKDKETVNAPSPKLISDVELAAERRRDGLLGKKQEKVLESDKIVKEESSESSQDPILVGQKDVKANVKPVETNQVALVAWSDSSMEDGFFQKLKRLWYGSPEMELEHLPEMKSVSGSGDTHREDNDLKSSSQGSGNKHKEDKDLKSSSQGTVPMSQISPSFVAESVDEVKVGADDVDSKDKDASPGFLGRLLKSFKFWGKNTKSSKDSSGNQELVNVDSQVQDIFAKEYFWSDIESFINSPRGFAIVSHSRTREVMAKNVQEEGPSCLRLLDESSMLHLVTLLISEKKWIEETPSSSLPFRIIKGSSPGHRHASNGLSSIFSDSSKSQWQKQNGEKSGKNVAHAGVSVGSVDRKELERYKSNAIADCQKMIKKITEEHPEGYSLIRFRKDFLEEYGYHLAVDKLGYDNLQSLIRVMHGVRIASGYIFPSTPSPNAKSKEDDSDLAFAELGPVSDTTTTHPTTKKLPVYEPSLSEDEEDSGSERDNAEKKKQQMMSKEGKESSLLQILDSYYTNKDGELKENPVERKLVSNGRKQKPTKTYSFVKDSEV
ncbi:putative NYN domain, limkain-b1-type, meiosis regulator and mRNA stability factor 1 [Arabidopsis thaliana]